MVSFLIHSGILHRLYVLSHLFCNLMLVIVGNQRLHISLGRVISCQHGAFSGVGAVVASFVPAECPKGGGYVGYIRKATGRG